MWVSFLDCQGNLALRLRLLDKPVKKLNRALHGGAEIVRDIVIIAIINIQLGILVGVEHLVEKQL